MHPKSLEELYYPTPGLRCATAMCDPWSDGKKKTALVDIFGEQLENLLTYDNGVFFMEVSVGFGSF